MYYDFKFINELIKKNKIESVISEYVNLEKRSVNLFVGICPFHNEKQPSLLVDSLHQTYSCIGCGSYGNVITFIMKLKSLSFADAVMFLANRAKLQCPDVKLVSTDKNKIIAMNNSAARYFYSNLLNAEDSSGIDYFRGRKLSDQIIRRFGLGYANDFGNNLFCHLLSLGYSETDIEKAGFSFVAKDNQKCDKFWNRVMFPIFNEDGKVVGFTGRVLDDKKPKYLNSSENILFNKGNILYGFNIAKNNASDGFILCEGNMDVISLHQAGFNNAIAAMGTALTVNQAEKIAQYSKKVYLAYDSDMPGINAAIKAIKILNSVGVDVKVITLGSVKDPDEFIQSYGIEKFKKAILDAKQSNKFISENLSEEERYKFVAKELLKYL